MTKPIGYYCDFQTGDGNFLDWLEQNYGSYLEGLSPLEKLHILNSITVNLIKGFPPTEAIDNAQKISADIGKYLSDNSQLCLADAIINQLKYQR